MGKWTGLKVKDGQINKLRALSKKCCYNTGGECELLEDKCGVSLYLTSIPCKWFAEAVLPLDEKLNADVLRHNKLTKKIKMYTKTCKECKARFKIETKTTQMCPKCSRKKELERKKAYKRNNG